LTAPYCYNNLSVFCFLFSLSTEVGGVGGSRCRWAGQCNDSGRRRSLVLVPRNTRYPPVEGVTKGPLSLSLPMDDELSAQSQAQFLPGFLAFSVHFGRWLDLRASAHGGLSLMHSTRSQDIGHNGLSVKVT